MILYRSIYIINVQNIPNMSPPICVGAGIGGRDHCICWDDSE